MTRDPRAGSTFAAGIVGLLVSAGYLGAWYLAVERPVCEQTGVFACAGPGILMYVVGVPVAYLVWSLALRAARAPLPWLCPVAVLTALMLLAPLIELPLWVWPAVPALLSALWVRLIDRRVPA